MANATPSFLINKLIRVQIIGLPGAGKTTALQELKIDKIDLSKYSGINREKHLLEDVKRCTEPVIIESVSGYFIKGSKVIKLITSWEDIQKNFYKREQKKIDNSLLALYESDMIPCHYKAFDQRALKELVIKIIRKKEDDRPEKAEGNSADTRRLYH